MPQTHRSPALRHPLLTAAIALCASAARAQLATVPTPAAPAPAKAMEQRAERIRHEDALTRVDELRVGGETRSITVQPKNGAPAYEVVPATGGEDPSATRNGSSGKSRWRLLDF